MKADGSAQKRLTRGESLKESPAWSPDGRKIAFGDENGLWVMNALGTGLRRLAAVPDVDDLAWSPDGRMIVFFDFIGQGRVYVVNADGSGLKRISEGWSLGDQPWSPDSRRIVFGLRDGLYVANADGSDRTRLASETSGEPTWSPNGRKIAFVRAPYGPSSTIIAIDVQGSNRRALARVSNLRGHLTVNGSPTPKAEGAVGRFTS
jgi:TolB protein